MTDFEVRIDALPVARAIQSDAQVDTAGQVTGVRFRATSIDHQLMWPWTRIFFPDEFPVKLKWAYLTEGDETPVIPLDRDRS